MAMLDKVKETLLLRISISHLVHTVKVPYLEIAFQALNNRKLFESKTLLEQEERKDGHTDTCTVNLGSGGLWNPESQCCHTGSRVM